MKAAISYQERAIGLASPAGHPGPRRSCSGQKGSALLIVFVFAAIVAISLYMEMPVAVFEAKRQKEQLLVDRGNEYAHAVKLYVRKTGRYPATLDALENTNNMRFLRHRFKDPFTGKDDWRLLHAGPGGMLLDSKSTHNNPLGMPAASGAGSGNTSNTASFGFSNSNSVNSGFSLSSASNTSQQGFGSGFSSSDSNSNSQPEVIVPPVPQRPPAVSANGAGAASIDTSQGDPTQSLVPAPPSNEQTASEAAATPGLSQSSSSQGQPNSQGQSSSPSGAAVQSTDASSGTGSANPTASGNAGLMQNLVGLRDGTAGQMGTGTMGQIASGAGIAGVASKAGGHSIKVVNDEDDYSRWEFYYDPRKDVNPSGGGMGVANGGAQANGTNGLGQPNNTQNSSTQSIFSSTPMTSGTSTSASGSATTASPQ